MEPCPAPEELVETTGVFGPRRVVQGQETSVQVWHFHRQPAVLCEAPRSLEAALGVSSVVVTVETYNLGEAAGGRGAVFPTSVHDSSARAL